MTNIDFSTLVAVADIRVPKDIFVLTPEEYQKEMCNKHSFIYKAVSSGVMVYESP